MLDVPVTSVPDAEFQMPNSKSNGELNCEHANRIRYDVLGRVVNTNEYSGIYYEVCSCGNVERIFH